MKRIIFAAIGCMTILFLTACSGNNTSNALDTPSSAVTDSSLNISAPINGMVSGSEQLFSASSEIQTSSFTEEAANNEGKSKITEIRIASAKRF